MSLSNQLEVCITRHEIGRDCLNCRYKGDACIKMLCQLMHEHKEYLKDRRVTNGSKKD